MTDELVFYHHPMSRGRIVQWMLEEVGAPYRTEIVHLNENEHKSERYLAINPMGKIPAIAHRGVVVTESAAICAYLADAFPAAGLAPALDDPARGAYYRWMFFAAGCAEYAMVDRMLARTVPAERRGTIGYGSYEDTFATLDQAIAKGPFLLGEKFSAADVYVGSLLGWGMMTKAIEPRASFGAYMERLSARPAFQRAGAKNDEISALLAKK